MNPIQEDVSGGVSESQVAGKQLNGAQTRSLIAIMSQFSGGQVTEGQAVMFQTQRDPLKPKWARVPAGTETCSFCIMLASRGFVYHSEGKAGSDGHYHPYCDCRIVPGFDGMGVEGYNPDSLYARYMDCADTLDEGWLHRRYDGLSEEERSKTTFDEYKTKQVLAEMRTRDSVWLNKGKIPTVEYQSARAEREFSVYEKKVTLILSKHGFGSFVLERSNVPGMKMPDVLLNGIRCDFKRPKGNGFNTIDGLVRDAGKKADMVVFYLEPEVSTATKEAVISHFEKCGVRRGIKNAIIVDYDESITRVKL